MSGDEQKEDLLVTPRQRALFKILSESGATEDGKDAQGRPFTNGPPYFATMMLDMALSSYPNEEQLIDILCWGDRSFSEKARPLARKILKLLEDPEDGTPPA